MAIVFIQSKKRQKTILWSIIIITVLILSIIPLIIFSPWLEDNTQSLVQDGISKPDISINLSAIDSEQVKDLEPFLDVVTEFSYTAKDKSGKQVTGKISAVNIDDAKNILVEMGFEVLNLEGLTNGRDEPFTPYYQPIIKNVTK